MFLTLFLSTVVLPSSPAAVEARVCREHALVHFDVLRCSCHVTRDELLRYSGFVADVEREFTLGFWRQSKEAAERMLEAALAALALCDEDADLHRVCLALGDRLGFTVDCDPENNYLL